MRATKVIYNDKNGKRHVTLLPIIFPTNIITNYTTVEFDGTTALFSNVGVDGNTLVVNGATINNNTLITEE